MRQLTAVLSAHQPFGGARFRRFRMASSRFGTVNSGAASRGGVDIGELRVSWIVENWKRKKIYLSIAILATYTIQLGRQPCNYGSQMIWLESHTIGNRFFRNSSTEGTRQWDYWGLDALYYRVGPILCLGAHSSSVDV